MPHRFAILKPLCRGLALFSLLTSCAVYAADKRDLIIDADPGADDMVALLMALASPEDLNVRAITTVSGKVRLEKTSRNARIAREWAGRENVPIYAGAPRPMLRAPVYAENAHGQEGIPGVPIREPRQGLAHGNAVEYLITTLRAAPPHSVTIAMLGPQTNLALALVQAPEITQGIKEVVVMGGAHFNGGDVTPSAEYNVYADPQAADVVLNSGVRLVYIPLDVTNKILTNDARLKQIADVNNHASQMVGSIVTEYAKGDMERYDLPGGPIHDASVIAYLLKPELFSGKLIHMSVETHEGPTFGETIADWYGVLKKDKNVFWVQDGDAQGVFDLLADCLGRLN